MAGFTTWGVVIPAMIAYAGLAGVPAQAGLYTALASLTLYAILGTSKQLVLASTSASAIMIGSTIAGFTPSNATAFYELVAVLVALTGAILFLCGLFQGSWPQAAACLKRRSTIARARRRQCRCWWQRSLCCSQCRC